MKYSKKSTGTRSTVSVWTVTTDGATRATAVVMAVWREAAIVSAGTGPSGRGGAGGRVRDCAEESDGLAPSHPTSNTATSATREERFSIGLNDDSCSPVRQGASAKSAAGYETSRSDKPHAGAGAAVSALVAL